MPEILLCLFNTVKNHNEGEPKNEIKEYFNRCRRY